MPRRGRLASTDDPDYEKRVQEALKDVATGQCPTKTAAAKKHGIKRSTLSSRSMGRHQPRRKAAVKQQLLTPEQEEAVLSWIKVNSSQATPLHPKELKGIVWKLVGKLPGKNWHRKFLERHADTIRNATARKLDPKRAQNFCRTSVGGYFRLRLQLKEEHGDIPPEHDWNMDERGNQMGGGRKGNGAKFIFAVGDKDRYRQHSDNLELMTVIECVNAAGQLMEPFFILKEGPLPNPDDPRLDGVAAIATSPNGWTDDELAKEWFTNVFLPQAEKYRVNDKPIVLTLDGHGSHESDDIKDAAYTTEREDMVIIGLPSKTTHKTQPLDVGIFGVVDREWTNHVDECLAVGVTMNRYNIIQEYMSIRHVMTPDLIQKAFKKTGISPLNPDVFTDQDFGPSAATSTSAADHLPPTYPQEIPTSPPFPDPIELSSDMEPEDNAEQDQDHQSNAATQSESSSDSDYMPQAHDQGASVVNSDSEEADSDSSDDTSSDDTSSDDRGDHEIHCVRTRSIAFEEDSDAMWAFRMPPLPSYEQVKRASRDEIWQFLQDSHERNTLLLNELERLRGQLRASESHCTLARRKIENVTERLENSRKKRGESFKKKARFITLPSMREQHQKERDERKKKQADESRKQAQKRADDDARKLRIQEEIKTRVFDAPLSSYKKKDDLCTLAGALGLSQDGNCDDLMQRIKDHVGETDVAESLKANPRFTGLFTTRRRKRAGEPSTAPDASLPGPRDSSIVPGSSSLSTQALASGSNLDPSSHPDQFPIPHLSAISSYPTTNDYYTGLPYYTPNLYTSFRPANAPPLPNANELAALQYHYSNLLNPHLNPEDI